MSNFTWFCLAGLSAIPFPLTGTPNCDPGWLCPLSKANESWTWPQECPPTTSCQVTRLSSQFCAPQGIYEPELCPPGYYCPDTIAAVECPAGTYCPRGSAQPLSCPAVSTCPAGSSHKRDHTGMVAAGVLDFVLIVALLAPPLTRLWKRLRKQRSRRQKLLEDLPVTSSSVSRDPLLAAGSSSTTSSASMSPSASPMSARRDASVILEAGFARCNAGVRLSLSFKDLTFTLPAFAAAGSPKTLLRGVSGTVRAGRLTAVMGPSGAGGLGVRVIPFLPSSSAEDAASSGHVHFLRSLAVPAACSSTASLTRHACFCFSSFSQARAHFTRLRFALFCFLVAALCLSALQAKPHSCTCSWASWTAAAAASCSMAGPKRSTHTAAASATCLRRTSCSRR